jgi:hypothetical protein
MLKPADRLWFKIKRHINPPNDAQIYAEAYVFGYNAGRAAIIAELQKNSLHNWSSAELRMGYDYAVHSAEKVNPLCL